MLKVLATPKSLNLQCTSLVQLIFPVFGHKLLHNSQQHPIGFEPSILFLGVKKFNLASLSEELHKELSVGFSLNPTTIHSLDFQGSSDSVIGREEGLVSHSVTSEEALNSY